MDASWDWKSSKLSICGGRFRRRAGRVPRAGNRRGANARGPWRARPDREAGRECHSRRLPRGRLILLPRQRRLICRRPWLRGRRGRILRRCWAGRKCPRARSRRRDRLSKGRSGTLPSRRRPVRRQFFAGAEDRRLRRRPLDLDPGTLREVARGCGLDRPYLYIFQMLPSGRR